MKPQNRTDWNIAKRPPLVSWSEVEALRHAQLEQAIVDGKCRPSIGSTSRFDAPHAMPTKGAHRGARD